MQNNQGTCIQKVPGRKCATMLQLECIPTKRVLFGKGGGGEQEE